MCLGVDGMRRGRWRGPADTADDESMFQAGITHHTSSVINVTIMRCQVMKGYATRLSRKTNWYCQPASPVYLTVGEAMASYTQAGFASSSVFDMGVLIRQTSVGRDLWLV